ncbi:MAG TPA: hypothetical protein DDZ51_18740 [Planctomycetaceae bacterium]|jgi:hypothetical protein|nr:hypothetical protein [Planctomycetaceae bacterium]
MNTNAVAGGILKRKVIRIMLRPPPNNTPQDFGQSALTPTFVDYHADGHRSQRHQAKQDHMNGRQDHGSNLLETKRAVTRQIIAVNDDRWATAQGMETIRIS